VRAPPLRGRQIAALRAIASSPAGLRSGAYPSLMAALVEMGLVVERDAARASHPSGRAWHLTQEGRAVLRVYGEDEA